MNKFEKNAYRYIYGGCVGVLLFVMIFTFHYVGINYIFRILYGLMIVAVSIIFQSLIEKSFPKHKIIIQSISGFILYCIFFIAIYFIAYLPTYIHEIGHALTVLSFKADVSKIILSPFEGKTSFDGEHLLDIQLTIVAASGVLGIILLGLLLLFLFYRNDNLTFKLYFPISLVILIAIVKDLHYFFLGTVTLDPSYDMTVIIQLNPTLDRWGIAYWCLFGEAMVLLIWIWTLIKKMRDLKLESTQKGLESKGKTKKIAI